MCAHPQRPRVTSPSVRGWSDQGHAIVSIALSPQALLERWAHRRYINVRRRLLHRGVTPKSYMQKLCHNMPFFSYNEIIHPSSAQSLSCWM